MPQSQAATSTAPVIFLAGGSPPLLLRVLYFLVVGWWLGGIVTVIAWLSVLTVLLLPIGLWLINRLPTIVTLRPQEQGFHLKDGVLIRGKRQHGFLIRAAYLTVVGWWLSAIWLSTAYLLVLTLIGIPIAFWMYGRAGAVTTLYRS
jgi:uncharacterized membrane protein YccF (DUF307 family)